MGLYVPEEYGGQGLSQTGYARVFEAIGQVDGSLTIGMGVHQSIGFKGIAHVRQRRAEGALPPRPRRRAQARGLRADRAERGLGRLQHRVARGAAVRRLVGAQRREALDRQRLPRRRADRVRPRRGRRQGPPHRAHPREGDGGARPVRPALQDARPARQPPVPRALQRRARAAGERARRARRRLQDRDAILTNGRIGLGTGVGRPGQAPARPDDRARHRAPAVRPARSPTSTSSRRRSPGWSCSSSASSRWPT